MDSLLSVVNYPVYPIKTLRFIIQLYLPNVVNLFEYDEV